MASHVFPQFSDGDVEIHFSKSDKYVLHSYVLALHSPWFKVSLSERWNTNGDVTASVDGKTHWIYELRFDKGTDFGLLVRKTSQNASATADTEVIENKNEKLPKGTSQKVKELHSKRVECLQAHQDMLGALYHVPPAFSHTSIDSAKSSILQLTHVADMYVCEPVTKLHTESHLKFHRDTVLGICASKPIEMLELAVAVKSEWIFTEAATYLLGCSKRVYQSAQRKLEELQIADLLNKKRYDIVERLQTCEFMLLRIQPSNNSMLPVLAIGFFRQWLSEELEKGRGSVLGPEYATLYRTILKGEYPLKSSDQ